MSVDDADVPMRERLTRWLEHLAHVLPAQAPIRDFVHHNTLHGFQHLPFHKALKKAQQTLGVAPYWPEARFLAAVDRGRISRADLLDALDSAGISGLDEGVVRGLTRRDVLLASLLAGSDVPGVAKTAWGNREKTEGVAAEIAHLERLLAVGESEPEPRSWKSDAVHSWQRLCDRVGPEWTLRSLLEHLTGEDVLEQVRSVLLRHMGAHLDLGVAAWRNPGREEGFYAAWRASAGGDIAWDIDGLHHLRDEILHLPVDPLDALIDALSWMVSDESLWFSYLERIALELPGWSGMMLWRERNPGMGEGAPVAMIDCLAVRVVIERLLYDDLVRRLTGYPMPLADLRTHFAERPAEFFVRDAWRRGEFSEELQDRAAHLVDCARNDGVSDADWDELAELLAGQRNSGLTQRAWILHGLLSKLEFNQAEIAALAPSDAKDILEAAEAPEGVDRGYLWLLAYERHYREQLFAALTANQRRFALPESPSAQVVFCMDDREEGTRRHLEEIAPDVETLGAAGFFGVAMYWQGIDDEAPSALCPIVVRPSHLVRETVGQASADRLASHAGRRASRLRWREWLYQATRRNPVAGTALIGLAALPSLAALTAATLAPGGVGQGLRGWRERFDQILSTRVDLNAEQAVAATPELPQHGFTDEEQAERVLGFLRMIGLASGFAPLVVIMGHGSGSRNNPHLSAYDCGACSGKHGGPNARTFAAMANRSAVRGLLEKRGLRIPEGTWFIGAEHNTCDDGIEWYDLAEVPDALQPALDALVGRLSEACRAHAVERCRRLASAPPRLSPWQARQHVTGRAHDISQARPELGHATNAAAFIGRRAMSRGLFLDRRVFLISYDPMADQGGNIVEAILLAAGPVGAGISLEYYFSTVDNERLGCGSKVTHNITGLFGVMDGADSDLRTGLPLQMVEIHEPMRLLVVVEQTTEVLTNILNRQPALQELINNEWIILAAKSPLTADIQQYCPRRGWMRWSGDTVLPQVARSADWFAGEREALEPALILGGIR